MKKAYTDEDLRRILGADRADSAVINQKMLEAYEEIRRRGNKNSNKSINRNKVRVQNGRCDNPDTRRFLKKAAGGFGAVAAAFMLVMIFCAMNPSFAEEIPVLGSIFSKMQGIAKFGGAPEDEIIYLQEAEQHADVGEAEDIGNLGSTTVGQITRGQTAGVANMWEESKSTDNTILSRYQAADQGLTVTLTEYYASNQGISIGVRVENEESFPEMAVMLAEPRNQLLQLSTVETCSFRDEGDQIVNGVRNLEGRIVDEHTFEGVMRIDYESIKKDLRKYNEAVEEWDNGEYEMANESSEPYVEISDDLIEEYEVPESFQMQLKIQSFRIYTKEEKYIVRGNWTIPAVLDIRQSTKDTATIWVNKTNEHGWGLEYVEISPTEVTIHPIKPKGSLSVASPIVLDKNNRPLVFDTNGNQFGTYGRDTSVITVYVCDDSIDFINQAAYMPDGTLDEELYAELLEEKAQYKKLIDTTQYLEDM